MKLFENLAFFVSFLSAETAAAERKATVVCVWVPFCETVTSIIMMT